MVGILPLCKLQTARLMWFKLSHVICMVWLIVFILGLSSVGTAAAGKCDTCKDLVKKFNEGMEKTTKSGFGGGNTKWEERSLGSFAFSETRFLEITENVCGEGGKDCHHMLEQHEEDLENWWFKVYAKKKDTELFDYFCISKVAVCCPTGTFGAECKACVGGTERPCTDNGQCDGAGTREGSGQCKCNAGYKGRLCDECKDGYYVEDKNDTHISCKKCDSACKTTCFDGGPAGCEDCKDGYTFDAEKGCEDIDECAENPCEEDEYCLNSPGSHKCPACDDACTTCTGSGAAKCEDCADGYYFDNDRVCQDCHRSCLNSCTDETPKSCDACREGWVHSAQDGCQDIDECEAGGASCANNEHCINTPGSFKCSTCHSACDGCTGAGAGQCKECKRGYARNGDNLCADVDECAQVDQCPGDNEKCLNTPGAFRCDCEKDFSRDKDGVCQAKAKDSSSVKRASGKSNSESKGKSSSGQGENNKRDKGKKTKSKSTGKKKKTDIAMDKYKQYWISLIGFALVGILLKSSVVAQLIVSCVFWGYLYWFSFQLDIITKKTTS